MSLADTFDSVIDSIDEFFDEIFQDPVGNQYKKLKPGTHLYANRLGYEHHGILIENAQVIAYLKEGVSITSYEEFAAGDNVYVVHHDNRKYSYEETVQRAHSRLGEDEYNLASNNCEHFANWCVTGEEYSTQVQKVLIQVAGIAGWLYVYLRYPRQCWPFSPATLIVVGGGATAAAVAITATGATAAGVTAAAAVAGGTVAATTAGGTAAGVAAVAGGAAAVAGGIATTTAGGAAAAGLAAVAGGAVATAAAPVALVAGGVAAIGWGIKKLFFDD